jgi:hypothetical protein
MHGWRAALMIPVLSGNHSHPSQLQTQLTPNPSWGRTVHVSELNFSSCLHLTKTSAQFWFLFPPP